MHIYASLAQLTLQCAVLCSGRVLGYQGLKLSTSFKCHALVFLLFPSVMYASACIHLLWSLSRFLLQLLWNFWGGVQPGSHERTPLSIWGKGRGEFTIASAQYLVRAFPLGHYRCCNWCLRSMSNILLFSQIFSGDTTVYCRPIEVARGLNSTASQRNPSAS